MKTLDKYLDSIEELEIKSNCWNSVNIDEIASKERYALAMGPFGSNIKKENYVRKGVPVLRGINIRKEFRENELVFLTEKKAEELKSSAAFPLDIVFVQRGNIGDLSIIPENSKFLKYIISQSLMKLTCNTKIANPYFVYYFFLSPYGQAEIYKFKSTVGVPALSQPLTSLRKMQVFLPELYEQENIIYILRTIDSKIELNHQMTSTLESLASSLFHSWFVRFDPFQEEEFVESELGPIPEGWTIGTLTKIAEYFNGKALTVLATSKGIPIIKIAELKKGINNKTKNYDGELEQENIAYLDDILFAWSASLGIYRWFGEMGAINQHIFKVIPKGFPKWFVYYQLILALPWFITIAESKTTTMGHIKRSHLEEFKIVIPSEDVLEKATFLIQPIYNKIAENSKENLFLSSLRDLLLPQLLSGKLRIKDPEKFLEEIEK